MNPAVTIIFLSASCVQIYGPETPAEVQVEKLSTAGRFNILPIPGALRGEVWAGGKVIASTHFDPTAAVEPVLESAGTTEEDVIAAQEAAEAAEEARLAAEAANPPQETTPESPPSPQEPVVDAEAQSGSPEAPAPPPAVSGKKKPA